MDFLSFFAGYFTCMVCDVIFSVCSYFLSRALLYKARIKSFKNNRNIDK